MPRGTAVLKQDLAEARKLRKDGLSVKEIAEKLGISYQQAYSRAGPRKRLAGGGAKKRGRKPLGLIITAGSPVTTTGTLTITPTRKPRRRGRPGGNGSAPCREAALVAFGVQMGLSSLGIALRALESVRA